jgi:G:T-mismatch repair DNA endonuclease (very short patch repair protein)
VFRKKLLQPDRIGIIPVGGNTDNRKQSKKAIAWLLHEEGMKGKRILHVGNGKEHRLPELPNIHVGGLWEKRAVEEFNECYWHGHSCMPFRDLRFACDGDTSAKMYENAKFPLERIAQAGYQIKVQWECVFQFPEDIRVEEEQQHLRTRDSVWWTSRGHAPTLQGKRR